MAASVIIWTLCAVSICYTAEALRPSAGCANTDFKAAADFAQRQIKVADFETVDRTYWVQAAPKPTAPAPLLLVFHGQGGDGLSFCKSHNFSAIGEGQNLMVACPDGINDSFPGEDQGTGWNAGSAGDNVTCVPTGVSGGGCYKSCRALKKCGRCNWSTCYNDVLFVKTVVAAIAQDFCIDLDRVYAHGESNGAMLVQHVVRNLPDTFAGIDTWFGTPLLGYLLGDHLQLISEQTPLSKTAYLSLHGRNDTCIPPQGGVDDSGWIYETLEQSTGIWAILHHCNNKATPFVTRWDGGPLNFRCSEYQHCTTGRRVIQCMYDGVHGDWPTGSGGDEITLWFLLQFSRSSPITQVIESVELV